MPSAAVPVERILNSNATAVPVVSILDSIAAADPVVQTLNVPADPVIDIVGGFSFPVLGQKDFSFPSMFSAAPKTSSLQTELHLRESCVVHGLQYSSGIKRAVFCASIGLQPVPELPLAFECSPLHVRNKWFVPYEAPNQSSASHNLPCYGHNHASSLKLPFNVWDYFPTPLDDPVRSHKDLVLALHCLLKSKSSKRINIPLCSTSESMSLLSHASSSTGLRYRVKIKGTKLIALLDTGASHSFCAASLVSRASLSTHITSGSTVNTAGGHKQISNQSISTTVSFKHLCFPATLHVLPELIPGVDCILGMDWLIHNLIVLHPSSFNCTTVVQGLTVSLPCLMHEVETPAMQDINVNCMQIAFASLSAAQQQTLLQRPTLALLLIFPKGTETKRWRLCKTG